VHIAAAQLSIEGTSMCSHAAQLPIKGQVQLFSSAIVLCSSEFYSGRCGAVHIAAAQLSIEGTSMCSLAAQLPIKGQGRQRYKVVIAISTTA
jgi:hypothetical protein